MNTREQQLRAELRAESELITPGSLRQPDFHKVDNLASAHAPTGQFTSGGRRLRLAWLAPIAAAASVAVIVATAAVISRHGPSGGQQPAGAGPLTAGQIMGVRALSDQDVWAVGYLATRPDQIDVPLIEHWNGVSWRRTAVHTASGDEQWNAIAGTSSDNLWAVGVGNHAPGADKPVIWHWNGRNWGSQQFPALTKAGRLNAVAVRSATDAWAVGQTGGHVPAALILHWDGRTWSKVPAPAATGDRFLSDVAAVSARNVWAVGSAVGRRFASQPYIIHWAGSSWMQVPAPHLRAQFPSLQSVAVGSDGTAWAVGLSGEQHLNAVVLRWTGTAWRRVPTQRSGLNAGLSAIAILSGRDIWAAGRGGGPQDTAILHWNGTTWTRMTSPGTSFVGGINDLSAISANDIWAAGFRGSSWAGVPQVLHWNGSKWTRSFGPASTKGLNETSSCGPYCSDPTPTNSPTP